MPYKRDRVLADLRFNDSRHSPAGPLSEWSDWGERHGR